MLLAIPFPMIDPVAVSLGPIDIRWYALAYVAGIAIGWWYMLRLVSTADLLPRGCVITRAHIDDYFFWATLAIILGGRFGYVVFYNPAYYLQNPLEALMIWQGGMAFHGGFLGIMVATFIFAKRKEISILTLGDLVASAAPIGLFFGRIANFINGELYGRITNAPWGMVFPDGGPLPRHPSQLYQAFGEGILLFIILSIAIWRFKALKKPGLVIGLFMVVYGVVRFLAEFVRQYDAQVGELWGIITMGQLLSLPMIAAGVAFILYARRVKEDRRAA